MRRVAQIILRTNSTGLVRDTIMVKISDNKEYHFPFVVRVMDNGLNFVDAYVDMGVLT